MKHLPDERDRYRVGAHASKNVVKNRQTRSSFTIVDVRVGVSEEDENRVLVELGATDSSRRCGNKLIRLTVEFEQTNLGHTVVALPLVQRDLRHRDVDDRSPK